MTLHSVFILFFFFFYTEWRDGITFTPSLSLNAGIYMRQPVLKRQESLSKSGLIEKFHCIFTNPTVGFSHTSDSDSSHVLDCVSDRSLKCTQYDLTVQDCSNVTCI